jgi:hypothetical protein
VATWMAIPRSEVRPSTMDHEGDAAAPSENANENTAPPAARGPVLGLKRRPAFNAPAVVKKLAIAAPGAVPRPGGGGKAASCSQPREPGGTSQSSGEARYFEVS